MKKHFKNIQAHPNPNEDGQMQLTYETESSRKLLHLPRKDGSEHENDPHGAGSFHDPEHHQQLIDRVEAMLRGEDPNDA